MGRTPTIDRDKVLDLAEGILLREGTGGLTIDAVAKAAGISKGGVQSRFGTKNDLVRMLCDRWGQEYEDQFDRLVGEKPTPIQAVEAHIEMSLDLDQADKARAAALMAALIEFRGHIAGLREWYTTRLAALAPDSQEGRRARLAFLATEGAFMLRAFGCIDPTEEETRGLTADLRALLRGEV
nr:TetR/AcrR family transcriptional regulator [uncultured Roseococcus sp.]